MSENLYNISHKNQIIADLKKHEAIYRNASIQGVLYKRDDLPQLKEKWLNYATKIILVPEDRKEVFEELIRRDNFLIFHSLMSVEELISNLESIISEKIFKIKQVSILAAGRFQNEEFFGSDRAQSSFGIDWGTSFWRFDVQDKPGLPSSSELELESESMPFGSIDDAIMYYLDYDESMRSSYQYTFYILLPRYYAKIKQCSLFEDRLEVDVVENITKLNDLVLRYNCSSQDVRSQAGSVDVETPKTIIKLNSAFRWASLWLYNKAGHKIDSRTGVHRTLNLREIIETLSSRPNYYYKDELKPSITRGIFESSALFSKNLGIDEKTSERCVDSVDREILLAIKTEGREYEKFLPAILRWFSSEKLMWRLGKLHALNMIEIGSDNKVALTPSGLDIILLPPSALKASVPENIATRLVEIQLELANENYDGVINRSTRLLEHILRTALQEKFGTKLAEEWERLKIKPYGRAGLGDLKDGCVRLKIFTNNAFSAKILDAFMKLRVPSAHETKRQIDEASIALMAKNLVEIFVRDWYYRI